ncbi:MAG: hypothetical protein IJB96_01760 [Lachnospira sp.]|nr:hypothetical protein [Lachnospira sp.]
MSVAYGIISVISLLLVGVCLIVDKKRDMLLLMMFVAVFICDLGYFLISIAKTLDFALNANRLAYLGSVFLPYCLLFMILNLCGITYKKWLPVVLVVISVLVLLVASSPGVLSIYYSEVSIEIADGATRLVREYGSLHILYYIYLFAYFTAVVSVIIYAIYKKKVVSKMHVAFLFSAVLCNIVIWLAEQFLPRGFEVLSVSYIMTEIFILLLYAILQEYGCINNGVVVLPPKHSIAKVESGSNENEFFTSEEIERIFSECDIIETLTNREKDVFRCILANKKRKDIAEELFVTESTIKKYTASVFKKMAVTNRMELFAKLKNYT